MLKVQILKSYSCVFNCSNPKLGLNNCSRHRKSDFVNFFEDRCVVLRWKLEGLGFIFEQVS